MAGHTQPAPPLAPPKTDPPPPSPPPLRCFINTRRALDVEYDDGDWPGNKAWPAGMVLVSFFLLAAFMQALVQDIITPSLA